MNEQIKKDDDQIERILVKFMKLSEDKKAKVLREADRMLKEDK